MTRREELDQNLRAVRERVLAAEKAAGREPGSVQLMPVTKFHPASDLELLAELGIEEVGENREQEARQKAAEVPAMRVSMIGQIQSKKVNSVARWAHAVHSVDSVRLAEGLNRGMGLALERGDRAESAAVLDCFVQLSADGDTSRGGVAEAGLAEVAEAIAEAEHLRLAGVMVVPPIGADAGAVFARARELADALSEGLLLSGGMSSDMEEAIAAGSNIVRVGTDILGARPIG